MNFFCSDKFSTQFFIEVEYGNIKAVHTILKLSGFKIPNACILNRFSYLLNTLSTNSNTFNTRNVIYQGNQASVLQLTDLEVIYEIFKYRITAILNNVNNSSTTLAFTESECNNLVLLVTKFNRVKFLYELFNDIGNKASDTAISSALKISIEQNNVESLSIILDNAQERIIPKNFHEAFIDAIRNKQNIKIICKLLHYKHFLSEEQIFKELAYTVQTNQYKKALPIIKCASNEIKHILNSCISANTLKACINNYDTSHTEPVQYIEVLINKLYDLSYILTAYVAVPLLLFPFEANDPYISQLTTKIATFNFLGYVVEQSKHNISTKIIAFLNQEPKETQKAYLKLITEISYNLNDTSHSTCELPKYIIYNNEECPSDINLVYVSNLDATKINIVGNFSEHTEIL